MYEIRNKAAIFIIEISCIYSQVRHLHSDSAAGVAVQAALHSLYQSSIADGGEFYAVLRVGDGMHFLYEGQGREGRVTIHHLVEDAAQAPDV